MAKPTSNKAHTLDIFKVLGNLSKKDETFYKRLSTEEQKALQPLVVMRWMTGTSDPSQIYFLNEFVNPYVFSLTNHKELLVDLMTVCSSGRSQRYTWKGVSRKKGGKQPIATEIVKEYFGYSTAKAIDVLPLLEDNVILNYAEQLGAQPDELKKLKKELTDKNK